MEAVLRFDQSEAKILTRDRGHLALEQREHPGCCHRSGQSSIPAHAEETVTCDGRLRSNVQSGPFLLKHLELHEATNSTEEARSSPKFSNS